MLKPFKIAVVGGESTGKTSICKQLASHYNTSWAKEYARQYCEKINHICSMEDEINIFWGQLNAEKEAAKKANKIFFCDASIFTVKVWCQHVLGSCPELVEKHVDNHDYHFFLLMDIDIPWQKDPLREFPALRKHFFLVWKNLLIEKHIDYGIVTGKGSSRLKNAVKIIDLLLESKIKQNN